MLRWEAFRKGASVSSGQEERKRNCIREMKSSRSDKDAPNFFPSFLYLFFFVVPPDFFCRLKKKDNNDNNKKGSCAIRDSSKNSGLLKGPRSCLNTFAGRAGGTHARCFAPKVKLVVGDLPWGRDLAWMPVKSATRSFQPGSPFSSMSPSETPQFSSNILLLLPFFFSLSFSFSFLFFFLSFFFFTQLLRTWWLAWNPYSLK